MQVYKIKDTNEKVLMLADSKYWKTIITLDGLLERIDSLCLVQKLNGTKVAVEKDKLEFVEEIKDVE